MDIKFYVCALFQIHLMLVGKDDCASTISANHIRFIASYFKWRNVNNLYLYHEHLKKDCNMKAIRQNMHCFNQNGIQVSLQSNLRFLVDIKSLNMHNVGIALLSHQNDTNNTARGFDSVDDYAEHAVYLVLLTNELYLNNLFNESLGRSIKLDKVALDTDLVIAIQIENANNGTKISKEHLCGFEMVTEVNTIETDKDNINSSYYGEILLPYLSNESTEYKNIYDICKRENITDNVENICLLQIFKIRKNIKESLVIHTLGFWNTVSWYTNLKQFYPLEKRTDFYGFPLIVGMKNVTHMVNIGDQNIIEDSDDENTLIEMYDYFTKFFKATPQLQTFSAIGLKNPDGEWTDLLGAVYNEHIDLALDTIVKTQEREDELVFTNKIMTSRRNIYIKPRESNEIRDIFSVPFGLRLIVCVIGTGIILSVVMSIINRTTKKFIENESEKSDKNNTIKISDSLVWCVAIFSMQGSIWNPRTYSGNIIVIISLAFAMIIYNSYSAFITSVLSVEISNIRSVEDLLESDYGIGYVRNSEDEVYLRSMNATKLKKIYLRGYLHNTVNNVTEGLIKTTKGNYGFFVTAHVARKQLQNISNYKCTYDIKEIKIHSTTGTIAFPMSKTSPYKKLINLSLMKMYETGVYKYIHSKMVPDLQDCVKKRTYHQAGLADLWTAFGILAFGISFGVVVAIFECIWKRKRSINLKIREEIFKHKHHHKARGRNKNFETNCCDCGQSTLDK